MELDKKIEAVLFAKGEPVSVRELAGYFGVSESEIERAVGALETDLSQCGVRLMRNGSDVTLASAPEAADVVEKVARDDMDGELSKAAIETLAIILYRGPIPKSRIDHIRGVNSVFILRNLQVRGLIEKLPSSEDRRVNMYLPTFELLAHLGVSKKEDLPEYETISDRIETFVKIEDNADNHGI